MRSVALQLGLVFLLLSTGCSPDKNGGNNDDSRPGVQFAVAQTVEGTQNSGHINAPDQAREELNWLDETQTLNDTQTYSPTSGSYQTIETARASEPDAIADASTSAELVNPSELVEKPDSANESEPVEIPEIPEILETRDSPTSPEMSDTDNTDQQRPEDTNASDFDNPRDHGNTENVLFPEYITPAAIEKCSVEDLKRRVYWDMHDYYIYADQVPRLNLADYDSPESLINALRVFPDVYSSVLDADTQFALTESGQREGFEFWFSPAQDGAVRFRRIWQGSSADYAGIKRGDEVIRLDGRPIEELSNSEINLMISSTRLAPLSLTVRTGVEEPRTVLVSNDIYQWVTAGPVTSTASEQISGLPKTAYLPVNAFVIPTTSDFDAAIGKIEDTGDVEELIVDLRYNGGGDVNIATYMAAIVGGEKVQGNEAYTNTWNDKYSSLNFTRSFDVLTRSLNFPRVIVLTTSFTASSSELFINTLKPYMEVVVIGERSRGKPYSNGIVEYCGKTLNIITVERTNSAGVSVAGGIQPDCLAEDNWETPADSIDDPHMNAAIAYIIDGTCNTDNDAIRALQPRTSRSPITATRFTSSIGPLTLER